MTRGINEFVELWNGKVCRDGQCVALFREYTEVFLRTPALERLGKNGGAEGLYSRFDHDVGPVSRRVFERIEYRPGMIPEPGDVIVFGPSATNRWGHVGMCVSADVNTIRLFEQNGIQAMRGQKNGAFIGTWNYDRVLGWLRLRASPPKKKSAPARQAAASEQASPPERTIPLQSVGLIGTLRQHGFNTMAEWKRIVVHNGWPADLNDAFYWSMPASTIIRIP